MTDSSNTNPSRSGPAFAASLASIVGAGNVLTHGEDVARYLTDARRMYTRGAECVVRPGSTAAVAEVVALCAKNRTAIVPQGGNTGLSGGSVPTGTGREVVLSLERLNRIRDLDPVNNTMTVEAGCILAQVQDAARGVARLFPISLAAEGSCQIGGNLSTNAGGVNVLRYGNARDQVLGLEVVLADGRIWEGLRGLRKDNTGYDLKQLFLGAEGTLGIITAAVLRLRPRPTATATAWAGLADPESAVAWLQRLGVLTGERLSAFELISRACLQAVLSCHPELPEPLAGGYPWYVLVELTDSGQDAALRALAESAFQPALEEGLVRDLALASSVAQAAALWKIRDTIPEAQFRNVKHDVSVPVSKIPALLRTAGAALEQAFPGALPYAFGHLGDGNIHYNIGMPTAEQTEELMRSRDRVNEIVFDSVARLGGSISAEHGVGQLKREAITRYKSAIEIELMRNVKKALDPHGIMNPGKVI